MRKYELVCIVQPELMRLPLKAWLIASLAGSVTRAEAWIKWMSGAAVEWRTRSASKEKVSMFS